MSDSLERFIKENREQFDDLSPKDTLWNKIDEDLGPEQELGVPKMTSSRNWWKVAAAILLVTTSWLLYDKFNATDDSLVAEAAYSQEFLEAETYYVNMINQRRSELIALGENQSELGQDFLIEIDRLDSMYTVLKGEFRQNSSGDQVLDAMIVNLQLRLNILNQQLEILERLKTLESDEKIST